MLRIDQVLHQRYRIVRQLGHGGMGAVYEAIDERFGEPIALKEIVFATTDERQKELVVKAFEREAKALAKAQHEVIPYVRDFFSELDRQFLVMEMVEGDDLAGLLATRQSPFPLPDCLKWIAQLLDALDYLHTLERPIIHRDIKPQNLKLNRRGKIKLLDFGIAKSSETAAATLSDQTFVGATLDYSPIEQILRAIDATFREYILLKHTEKAEKVLRQTTDTRCDLYALGATAYHLLTNHPPPDAVKRTLEVWEERPDPLADPSLLNPLIPSAVSACLLKAMAIEREDRYSSALEMHEALQEAIAGDKILENRVYNESWKAEQLRLHVAEAERRREQLLMQAKTAVLNARDVPAENENTSNIQNLPTERLLVLPSDVVSSSDVSASESSPVYGVNTVPVSTTGTDFTDTSYTHDTANYDRTTAIYETSDVAAVPAVRKKTSKALWILPAAVVGVFAMGGGVGGAIWLLMPDSGGQNGGTQNINSISVSTPTPLPTPGVLPSRPVFENRPIVAQTPARTPQPTPIGTPEKTPRPTPIRTPPRTPPPKTPDPNCVYNNTCK